MLQGWLGQVKRTQNAERLAETTIEIKRQKLLTESFIELKIHFLKQVKLKEFMA